MSSITSNTNNVIKNASPTPMAELTPKHQFEESADGAFAAHRRHRCEQNPVRSSYALRIAAR